MSPTLQLLVNLLMVIVSGGPSGPAIYKFIEWLDQFKPGLLSGQAKFNLAVILALLVPPAAYSLVVALTGQPFDVATLIMAIFTGYLVSQQMHFNTEKTEQAPTQEPAAQ